MIKTVHGNLDSGNYGNLDELGKEAILANYEKKVKRKIEQDMNSQKALDKLYRAEKAFDKAAKKLE